MVIIIGCWPYAPRLRSPVSSTLGLMKALLLVLAVLASGTWAQHVAVPSEVTTVITAGRWTDGPVSGAYRVVVVRDGWEHVWSRVYVEWLPDPTARNEPDPKPVSVKELISPGVAQGSAVLVH